MATKLDALAFLIPIMVLGGGCGDSSPETGDGTSTEATTGPSGETGPGSGVGSNTAGAVTTADSQTSGASTTGGSSTEGSAETGGAGTSTASSTTAGEASGSTSTTASDDGCGSDNARVAPLVQVPHPDGGTYGIDATEVTNAQYCSWLQTDPDPSVGQPSSCGWNENFEPLAWPYDPDQADRPVTYVDWCDAYAYCEGVGKRLCGHIDGGANDPADTVNAQTSQWYRACSQGGVNDYPYGEAYQLGVCNDAENGVQVLDVGSMPDCQASGDYAGVFDLNGNVNEWEDSCTVITAKGDLDNCFVRGGGYANAGTGSRCSWASIEDRTMATIDLGFRCCEA